jgi:hypothetical protein
VALPTCAVVGAGAEPVEAAVTKPFALTVILATVNEPTFALTVASVPAPVTAAEPLNEPLVYAKSPVIAIVRPVAKVVAVLAFPLKAAVTVPAVKFPLASRATIALAVFADVAVVAELLTLDAVEIVASLVSTMPAAALMSASTITPAAIEVALPTEVTSPVRLAFVVTLPAVKPEAVPVIFVPTNAAGVPRAVAFPEASRLTDLPEG